MRKNNYKNLRTAGDKRKKAYLQPIMYACALASTDGLLITGSIIGGSNGIGNGGNASGQETPPPMDTKGDWEDIWDE